MAEKLTPQQKEAVENQGGVLLVSAAAGSGKTKVLVDRLLRYVNDPINPANIDDFLIITYTKAAAAELRGKIAAKLTEHIARDPGNKHLQQQVQRIYLAKISTVHSFCADILREYAYILNLPTDFRVMDEKESADLEYSVVQEVIDKAYTVEPMDPNFNELLDTQGIGRDDRKIPEIMLNIYKKAKCHLEPMQWLDWCISISNTENLTDSSETVYGKYLIEDLHKYLKLQITALEKCLHLAEQAEEMDKPIELLRSTIDQMNILIGCTKWDDIHRLKKIDFGRLLFSKKCSDLVLADKIKAVRNACKDGVEKKLKIFTETSDQTLAGLQSTHRAICGLVTLVKDFDSYYESVKRRKRVLDFSDLEHKMIDLLLGKMRSSSTKAAYEIAERFREIMVDEYQDSNVVQDTIFSVLTEKKHNCFMVGDVKQSIYQFRLADPDIFLDKYNQYVDAEDAEAGEGRRVILSHNFRSAGSVISAVNDVFSLCMSPEVGGLYYDESAALREGVPHIPASEPEVELHAIIADENSYSEEASFVADRILQLLDGSHFVRQGDAFRPIVPDDIVILLRSPGSTGYAYKYALENKGIRCVSGGGTNLLATEEIETINSLLHVINNPYQDIPLISVLSSKLFCFTADDLAQFRADNAKMSIFDALKKSNTEKGNNFIAVLSELRKEAKRNSVSGLINKIFLLTRIDSIFSTLPNGAERLENLQAFCGIASGFEASYTGGLREFIAYLDMLQKKGVATAEQSTQSGAVTIMSIHKSKGLEFPVVFLCGLSRKFNRKSALADVLCDKNLGLGLSCVDAVNRVRYPSLAKRAIAANIISQGQSEEMRVLYVAMTRAKDRLIMTYTSKHLRTELASIGGLLGICEPKLLTKEVNCPGKWVLMAALKRTEATKLQELCGHPVETITSSAVWHIEIHHNEDNNYVLLPVEEKKVISLTNSALQTIKTGLSYNYPYAAATIAPSKQTATQLKGRDKDIEIQSNAKTQPFKRHRFRNPSFVEQKKDGAFYGTVMHKMMQYIRLDMCADLSAIAKEVDRLQRSGYLSEEESSLVNAEDIFDFFQTEIGKKLTNAPQIVREFKFSLLVDGRQYYDDLTEERILLQGVVDCAIIDEDGIIVIDFKTDKVTEESIDMVTDGYRLQLQTYTNALAKIYEKPVKNAYLYYFSMKRFVELN